MPHVSLLFACSSTTLHGFAAPSVRTSANQAELGTDEIGARPRGPCRLTSSNPLVKLNSKSNALRSSSVQDMVQERVWCGHAKATPGRRDWCGG